MARRLTPLSSELRHEELKPAQLSRYGKWRARRERERKAPTTVRGMIARGLLRLGVAIGIASGLALLVDHFTGRATSFGFYILGAFLLGAGVLLSAGSPGSPYYFGQAQRVRNMRMSVAYVVAGAIVCGIAVAIDAIG